MSKTQSDAERRRSPRFELDGNTPLVLNSDGRSYSCAIEDISVDGLRLHFEGSTPKKGAVSLEHPAIGVLQADCVWSTSDDVGVMLDEPERDLQRVLQCVSLIVNAPANDEN